MDDLSFYGKYLFEQCTADVTRCTDELRRKFMLVTESMGERAASALYTRLARMEDEPHFPPRLP